MCQMAFNQWVAVKVWGFQSLHLCTACLHRKWLKMSEMCELGEEVKAKIENA